METHRLRRQHRSCDQCRKGKRACDGEVPEELQEASPVSYCRQGSNLRGHSGSDITPRSPCSNCEKWQKYCTYNWLYAVRTTPRERRKKKPRHTAGTDAISTNNLYQQPLGFFSPSFTDSSGGSTFPLNVTSQNPSLSSSSKSGLTSDPFEGGSPGLNTSRTGSWGMSIFNNPYGDGGNPFGDGAQACADPTAGGAYDSLDAGRDLSDCVPTFFQNNSISPRTYGSSPGQSTGFQPSTLDLTFIDDDDYLVERLLQSDGSLTWYPGAAGSDNMGGLSFASNSLAEHFERSALAQKMFRIYHDSMENALSCWLTEQNCPYSMAVTGSRATNSSPLCSVEKEWGPNWSNRICSRVCQLDRTFRTFRGQGLTAVEDKMASRSLFTSIMAFASQWATKPQQSAGDFNAGRFPPDERRSRENLWNQARHALDASAAISSFRVAFANIIFSLTQRPLNISEHISALGSGTGPSGKSQVNGQTNPDADETAAPKVDELHDLFDNDCAPLFLDTAVRQLFAFRYKLTRIQRMECMGSNPTRRNSLNGRCRYNPSPRSISQRPGETVQASGETSRNLLSPEDNETFNLLFWLGVMFDTLTAAMHQRPPAVSDEDSEVSCAAPLSKSQAYEDENGGSMDACSATPDRVAKRPGVWGDLFLRKSANGPGSNIPRWPCTYREAAETLCDAAPVKVLFFRRVSRLQTLIYRGSGPECLERAIQDAFWVYQHWNFTYKRFMLDCIMNHDTLPPRIQSWYVILAGHWHLAAMLLADTLEGFDRAEIGLDSQREFRRAMDLVTTLRRENAVAVSNLAYSSLHGQDPSFAKAGQFHDSVNEGAFLTEPWTAVLIRSFTKAGYNLLNEVDASAHAVHLARNDPSEQARLQCGHCLDALWCLGRKSDMALLAATVLSSCVKERLQERHSQSYSFVPEFGMGNSLSTVPGGYDYDIPVPSIGPVF